MDQKRNQKDNLKILWDEWNENISYQNIWVAVKAMLSSNFKTGKAYIKEERSQIKKEILCFILKNRKRTNYAQSK